MSESNEADNDREDELVRRFIGGDRAALEELLLRNYDWLEAYISGLISKEQRNLVQIEDVIQEVYLRVFRKLDSFEPEGRGQLFSWLQTIARNTLFDILRTQKRKRKSIPAVSNQVLSNEGDELQSFIEQLAAGDDSRVTRFVQAKELRQAFWVALTTLTDDYRRTIELLYIEEKPIEEVAEALGKSVDAIRGIRTRARNQLREALVRLSLYV
ncbi:MAG: RNA polymerase sigma factor [Pirellulaceae bacterium]